MLIRFIAENFRSIDEEVVFSLIPGRMQKHDDHIITTGSDVQTLRLALIYGPNASGKSNLVKAMDFARTLILKGLSPKQDIPVEPFRLDKERVIAPSRFEFEVMVGKEIYAYGFIVDRRRVYEEWLYLVNTNNEFLLFERKTDSEDIARTDFSEVAIKDTDPQFLKYVARGTRPNQLLLRELVEKNVGTFEPLYDWFRNTLQIVFPGSHARGIQLHVHQNQKYSYALAAFLRDMYTGIDEVNTKSIELESIGLPMDELVDNLDIHSTEERTDSSDREERIIALDTSLGHRYLLHQTETGSINAHVLGTRRYVGNESVDFDLLDESDGTQRLFDLFPMLYGAVNRVFVIDELERSLHPNLVRRFLEIFLESDNRNQLIFTTHESTLLDLNLVRRDEIWFVEKSPTGASMIYSLEDFKPRHDLDIRKGYLHGRFGAIPIFGSNLEAEYMEA